MASMPRTTISFLSRRTLATLVVRHVAKPREFGTYWKGTLECGDAGIGSFAQGIPIRDGQRWR